MPATGVPVRTGALEMDEAARPAARGRAFSRLACKKKLAL